MNAEIAEQNSGTIIRMTNLGFEFWFDDLHECALWQAQLNLMVGVFLPQGNEFSFLVQPGVEVDNNLMQSLHFILTKVKGPNTIAYDLNGSHHVIAQNGDRVSIARGEDN